MTRSAELEVEEKFHARHTSNLIAALQQDGFREGPRSEQIDTYFSDPSGEFVRNNTCLRTREDLQRGLLSLDFKGSSADINSSVIAKIERNLRLMNHDVEEVIAFIGALGFLEHVAVHKTRRSFTKNVGEFAITVAIDEVREAGEFVEIEVTASSGADIQAATEILEDAKRNFSSCIGEAVCTPYRDLVASQKAHRVFGASTRAIAFDLDGTVIPETTDIFFESWLRVSIERDGLPFSYEDYIAHEVNGNETLFSELKARANLSCDSETYFADVYARYSCDIDRWLETNDLSLFFKPLWELKGDFRLALVTHSRRAFVEKIIQNGKAENLFDVVLCREDLTDLKPNPSGYTSIVEQFNISPEELLVVEDSLKGLEAAKSAGARAVLVSHHSNLHAPRDVPVMVSCGELALLALAID